MDVLFVVVWEEEREDEDLFNDKRLGKVMDRGRMTNIALKGDDEGQEGRRGGRGQGARWTSTQQSGRRASECDNWLALPDAPAPGGPAAVSCLGHPPTQVHPASHANQPV